MTARQQRRLTKSVVTLVLGLFILLAQQQGWLGENMEMPQPGYYRVTRFSDGDTIVVDMNGSKETIRFIGVDTPETHKPNTPVQCYGPAASVFTKNLIGSQPVRLSVDPQSTNRDRYNRLLRYVYLPDGQLINKVLIEGGYGFYYPYFPFTKSDEFAKAQEQAQVGNKGIWANCKPEPKGEGFVSNPA